MLTIKGFINISAMTDNRNGSTAMYGEISSHARTFSRDIGEFVDSRWPGVELLLLSSKNDQGTVALDTEFAAQILQVSKWVTTYMETATATTTRQDLLTAFLGQFLGAVNNPACGTVGTNGINRMPDWLSWSRSGAVDNEVKIWFSTASLERDYDGKDIVVVPPIPNIDIFFRPVSEIKAALAAISTSMMFETIDAAKAKLPPTSVRAEDTEYINPNIAGSNISVPWYTINYGPAGDNSEAARVAIIEYILAHTSDTETSWKNIFPDLFRSTQMYILPRWDKYAIPNRTDIAGIYSPGALATESIALAKLRLPDLPALHIDQNLEIVHHTHKSITLLCVGNTDNRDQKFRLSDYVSDYIAEASTHQDFYRQKESTKQWSILMEQMIIIAETATDHTTLPSGMRRVTKSGIRFIAKKLNGVEYLVATKNNA